MAVDFDFIAGIDPTALSEITGAQLKQLVDAAEPADYKGMIIAQAPTPDVANNPRYAKFLWLDLNGILNDGNAPYTLKYYNPDTPAWEPINLGLLSIDGANIDSETIDPVDALNGEGLADGLILITNAESWALITLADAIADKSITLAKLEDGGAVKDVMMWNGSAWAITQISYGDIQVSNGQIPTEKLGRPASESYILAPDPDDNLNCKWFPITDIITRNIILYAFASSPIPWAYITKGAAFQLPIMSDDGSEWVFIDKTDLPGVVTTVEVSQNLDTLLKITGGNNGKYEVAHNLGQIPAFFQAFLRCVDASNSLDYAQNDLIPLDAVTTIGTDDYQPINAVVNLTNVIMLATSVSNFYVRTNTDANGLTSGHYAGATYVNIGTAGANELTKFDMVVKVFKFS